MKLLDKKDFLKSLNESAENQDDATAGAPGEGEEKEVVEIFTLKVVGSETGIENLRALVEYIKENGNTGHSFTITVDPDDAELKKDFGWDGDGADSIESVDVEIITDEIEDEDGEEEGEEEDEDGEEDENVNESVEKEQAKAIKLVFNAVKAKLESGAEAEKWLDKNSKKIDLKTISSKEDAENAVAKLIKKK